MRTVLTILLALSVSAVASAQLHGHDHAAEPGAVVPPSAMMLLGAIDVPLTPDTVIWSGLTAEQATAVALDERNRRYLRVRAVGALGVIGGVQNRRLIETLAVNDDDPQVRVQALISLSRIWGADDRPAVEAFLFERMIDDAPAVNAAITRELAHLAR